MSTIPIRFVKMSGAGNDFLVLDRNETQRLGDERVAWVRSVCRRRASVGADGVLFVEVTGEDRARVEFRNPDGSEAFCGNGTRCAAMFAHVRGGCRSPMWVETSAGDVRADVVEDRVRIELPAPRALETVELRLDDGTRTGRRIEAGCPHCVLFVDHVDRVPLETWGPRIRHDPRFAPAGVNVDVASVGPGGVVSIRTWERGVEAETLACGSGALAVARAMAERDGGRRFELLPRSGRPLEVTLEEETATLLGDALFVYEGTLLPGAQG